MTSPKKKNESYNSHWRHNHPAKPAPNRLQLLEHCVEMDRELVWKSLECPLKKPYACSTHSYSLRSSGVCISRSSIPWISLALSQKSTTHYTLPLFRLLYSSSFFFIQILTVSYLGGRFISIFFQFTRTHPNQTVQTKRTYRKMQNDGLTSTTRTETKKNSAKKKKTTRMEQQQKRQRKTTKSEKRSKNVLNWIFPRHPVYQG